MDATARTLFCAKGIFISLIGNELCSAQNMNHLFHAESLPKGNNYMRKNFSGKHDNFNMHR